MWIFSFLSTVVEKTAVLSLLNGFGAPVKNQLTVYVRVYFWALYSIPLIYMPVFVSAPHCFDYHSCVVSFEIRSLSPSNLFFFFKIVLSLESLEILYEFQNRLFFLQKMGFL